MQHVRFISTVAALAFVLGVGVAMPAWGEEDADSTKPKDAADSKQAAGSEGAGESEKSEEASKLVIHPGERVGPIRFGMTREAVVEALGEPARKPSSHHFQYEDAFAIVFSQEDEVRAMACGWFAFAELKEAREHPFPGRFANGVGMGASKQEVREAFGKPKRTHAVNEEQDFVSWDYPSEGLRISFREGKLAHVWVQRRPSDEEGRDGS